MWSRASAEVCGPVWILLLVLIPWDLHKKLEAFILLASQRSAACGNTSSQSVAVGFIAKTGKDTESTVG